MNTFHYSWNANQVIGAPNVYPVLGTVTDAYSPLDRNANQYISVSIKIINLLPFFCHIVTQNDNMK